MLYFFRVGGYTILQNEKQTCLRLKVRFLILAVERVFVLLHGANSKSVLLPYSEWVIFKTLRLIENPVLL